MAYSNHLAERVRSALIDVDRVEEKKMFGGLAFLVNEKMCINAGEHRLMFRIDPKLHAEVVRRDGCQSVVMNGREYKGFINVSEDALSSEQEFDYWIDLALSFNMRAKKSKRKKRSST